MTDGRLVTAKSAVRQVESALLGKNPWGVVDAAVQLPEDQMAAIYIDVVIVHALAQNFTVVGDGQVDLIVIVHQVQIRCRQIRELGGDRS